MDYSLGAIDKHFDTYRKSSTYDDLLRGYTFKTFAPFLEHKNPDVLEFGCSDGQMTERIAQHANLIDVVDGSARFIEVAKARNISNASFHHSLFDEFIPAKKYDGVFATFILTHIPDIPSFFSVVKRSLKTDGLLFVAVPNSRVLSRQLALHMGLLQDLFFLSENDIDHGHCRCYDRVRLNRDLESNGFDVIAQGGIILKPLADFQMDKLIELEVLKEAQMEGLYKLGLEYPDLSGAIYCVCKMSKQ
jgi:2-polyprenyl-3-methyl-5-hydroxy-6-metoxy-1,4-benzoquinol methylase